MSYDLDLDLDNTCRVCLAPSDKLLNLFTTQIVDGYVKTMPAMVYYCLDIIVDESDILPKKICVLCKTTIIRYFAFKQKCKRTEQVLNEVLLATGQVTTIKEEIEKYSASIEQRNVVSHWNNKFADEVLETVENNESFIVEEEVDDIEKRQSNFNNTNRNEMFAEVVESIEQNQAIVVEDQDEATMEGEYSFDDHFEDTNDVYIKIEEVVRNMESSKPIPTDDALESMSPIEEHLTEEISIDNEILQDEDLGQYLCGFCEKVFEGGKYLEHCEKEHLMCSDCQGTYDTVESLNEHRKIDHKVSVIEIKSNLPKRKPSRRLFCDLCNKRWSDRERLNQHMKSHEVLNNRLGDFDCYKCEHCNTVYMKPEDLEMHTRTNKHVEIDEDAICTDYKYLRKFKPKTTNGLICGVCEATYPNMERLKNHMIIHFESFCCPFEACGCEYFAFARLAAHIMKKHIYGEEHFCPYCREKRFDTFDLLQEHIRDECSAKKFTCDFCDKKFVSKRTLKMHLQLHGELNAKKYQCSDCGKTFAQSGELGIHMRSHTGERPFKCTICSKTYKTASHRAAHMDVHIDGKTFQCNICDKKLQSRICYRTHMRKHAQGKKHKCDLCSKQFFTKSHLFRHSMNLHHRIKNLPE